MTGSTVTKYYYAGAQRVAMRQGTTLYYLLSDHLGSTSLTTDASGNVISELRYSAWGEVRYQSGVTPTEYTYTGQRSYTDSFGLMYFNARWLDVSLGRFAQADSIMPSGVQGMDRYAYANNSPIVFNDPSGHESGNCYDRGYCDEEPGGGSSGGSGGSSSVATLPISRSPSNPYDILSPLLRFAQNDLCYFVLRDSTMCSSGFWKPIEHGIPSLPQPTIAASGSGCLQSFSSCYDPDAIMWGAGLSGSEPGLYNTAGLEEVVMFSDLTRATYSYGGQGGSVGAGASAAAYGGAVFNLEDPDNYIGPFASAGLTVSVVDVGLTGFYFWDDSKQPFSAGTTQGIAIGYAPGAQASWWWSTTAYSLTWRSDR